MNKTKRARAVRGREGDASRRWTAVLPPAVVVLAAAVVYANTGNHGFVFDDIEGILNNPLISRFDSLGQILPVLGQRWRPLTQLSYGLTHYLFGFDPRAFHLFNVFLHAVNSLLVYAIAASVARRWIPSERSPMFAFAAGLIFAVHPLHSEAVAYVWGRSSLLCGTLYFGSLLLVLLGRQEASRRRRLLWYAGALLAGIMAWWAKEEAITLPFMIAGFFILAGSWRAAAVALLTPLLLLANRLTAISQLYAEVAENRELVSAGLEPVLAPWVYFLTHIKCSVFYYLRRFAVPLGLNADPAVVPVSSVSDPLFVASVFVLLLLCAGALVAAKRNRAVTFGLMALLISPLTAYALMPLADVVAEHRVYISGLGFAVLIACLLTARPRYARPALAVIAIILGFATVQRNRVWADGLSLWTDTAQKSPGLARPHLNLGHALQAQGQLDAALAEYQRALSINPKIALAHINMSAIYHSRGDVEGAKEALHRAIELAPGLISPYINLGIIALRQNDGAQALELLDRAAAIEESYLIHFNRGDALFQLGRYDEAIRAYNRAIELEPNIQEMRKQIDLRKQRIKEMGALR